MDDTLLIERVVKANDHDAFRLLVEKYQKMVITTCMGFTENQGDAEDIAQDVFVELYQSLDTFRKEAKLSTWVYRIAVNKSLNFIRKKKRESLFSNLSFWNRSERIESGDDLLETDPEYRMLQSERKRELKEAINRLPENQRVAIVLSTYQELSYKEIAEVMEVSLSAVESLLFRARGNLRKFLNPK